MISEPILVYVLDGILKVTDEGCGCCAEVEEVTKENVDDYITNVKSQLALLEKFKEENA